MPAVDAPCALRRRCDQHKLQGLPVSLEQLQDARQPRMLRGTGKNERMAQQLA